MPKVILLLLIIFLLVAPSVAFATTMKYQVDIGAPTNIGPNSIGTYIAAIYKTALGVVGVLAVVVMMFGGIMWMMAGGNPERIQSAKGWVFGAMSGLVLAFSSYTILNIINPDLVKFEAINIKEYSPDPTTNNNDGDEVVDPRNCCDAAGNSIASVAVFSIHTGKIVDYTCSPYDGASDCNTYCSGKPEDTKCGIGSCYNNTCWQGDGQAGDPCGNAGGSTCKPGNSCITQDWGGRDCISGLWCCKK